MAELVESSLLTQESTEWSHQQRRFIIYGIGGSGKTQFCCKFAQDHRERFWGVFWIDVTSPETAKQSFAKLGKTGELEATESAGKHWLSHLEEPWLLIINNADDPTLDLQSLFPEGDRGHILVTTRNPNFQIHATVGSAEFKGLEEREALLLLRAAGVQSPWDFSTEDNGNEITDTLGYLALALIHTGALIFQKICGLKDYLDFYNEYRQRLSIGRASKAADDHDYYAVYSTWDLSLNFIEQQRTEASCDAAQLLHIVAFFHFEHIRVDVFTRGLSNRSKALDSPKNMSFSARIFQAIRNRLQPPLRSFSLISYDGKDDSFPLHPVVHAWARDRNSPGSQALWAQVALNTLAEAIQLPPNDSGEAHEEFRRDILPHLNLCLAACPIQIIDYEALFGGYRLPLALVLKYMVLLTFGDQVWKAAKFGYVYLERGFFRDAAVLLLSVKDALVQSRGYKNNETMLAMLALAKAYWGLGRLKEAVVLQKFVVEARTEVLGTKHAETLSAMDQLGQSYWLNGEYHEALELQALTTERMKETLGPEHTDTLAAMDNLGVTHGSWQRYEESVEVHRKVLEFRKKKLGPTHVDTLTTINNVAMALFDLGQIGEAKQLMDKVYEERKAKLGKEHPWTLWALCYLAKITSQMGLLQDAEEMLIPGIEAAKRSLGDDHLGVLMGTGELARVYTRQRRFQEAEVLIQQTLIRLEQSRGSEHPDTVYALWKMSQP
ncbi:hypothetical protein MMC30_001271 [Trapelia coarctata]|nr:hypothetical protein [Trapelia coarctata]